MGLMEKNKKTNASDAQGVAAMKRPSVLNKDAGSGLETLLSKTPASRNEALQALRDRQSKNSLGAGGVIKEES